MSEINILLSNWGSLASILSFIIVIINSFLILSIRKKIRTKRSLSFIIARLNEQITILTGGDEPPSDLTLRIRSNLNDIKKYKYCVFNLRLFKLIKEVVAYQNINDTNSHLISQKLNLIIIEIDNF